MITYHYSLRCGLTNWDDHVYTTANKHIREISWDNISYVFTHVTPYKQYLPLVNVSFMIDYQIDGNNPIVYHFINVLFHIINVILVFLIISKFSNNFFVAALTALIYGLHPIQVESVTWVTERKNVLFALFFFWSLLQYLQYLKNRKYKNYFWCLFLFIVALFAKSSAVTLGISLLAFDYFYRRNLMSKRVILEKIPFVVIAVIFGYVTLHSHSESITNMHVYFAVWKRIIFAIHNYIEYIILLIAPYRLSAFYPYPVNYMQKIPFYYWFHLAMLIGFIIICIMYRKRRALIFGVLFYTINIVLFIQIIPNSSFMMADRYTYIASIGVFYIIAVGFNKLKERINTKIVYSIIAIYILFLSLYTYQRTKIWKNSVTLWSDVVSKYTHHELPWFKLGDAYMEEGNNESAIACFDSAAGINSGVGNIYTQRGIAKGMLQDYTGAIYDFSLAIRLNPDNVNNYADRGNALIEIREYEKAIKDLENAINLDSNYTLAYYNKGKAYMYLKNFEQALQDYDRALELNPDYEEALYARGFLAYKTGDEKKGCEDLEKAKNLGHESAFKLYLKYCKNRE